MTPLLPRRPITRTLLIASIAGGPSLGLPAPSLASFLSPPPSAANPEPRTPNHTPARPHTPSFSAPSIRFRLVPVEQAAGDLGPLATSLRAEPADLRIPLGFDRVYKLVPIDDPHTHQGTPLPTFTDADGSTLYARASGALVAIFERSQYVPTRRGLRAVTPPGTVFLLADPSNILTIPLHALPPSLTNSLSPATTPASNSPRARSAATQPAYQPADLSANAQPATAAPQRPTPATPRTQTTRAPHTAPDASPHISLWTSEGHRRDRLAARLAELLGPSPTPITPQSGETPPHTPRSTPARDPADPPPGT